ncbi:MAG TPA: DUF4129 domain-containing protein [Dongiaceae bacterium]|nr:DUF4129 domain-containing protein [Dongiaceae bacterium]
MNCKARGLWLLLALATLCPSAPAWAQETDAEQIRNEAEKALERSDIQRDAPLAERVRQQADNIAKDPSLQHEPPTQKAPPEPNRGIPIPPKVFLYLLIAVLVVTLCIVGYHLYGTYGFGRRVSKKKIDQPLQLATQPIIRTADAPLPDLDEIERLARSGAYAEAIHLMLLRALEALRRRLGTSWAKSMTSREIARRSELPASDRGALKMLVGAVEISRFGGQSANEQIYRACLDQYRLIGESGAFST